MGPLGIGDTIFGVITSTVFGSIAAYGIEWSSAGIWIWLAWSVARWFIRWEFTKLGL